MAIEFPHHCPYCQSVNTAVEYHSAGFAMLPHVVCQDCGASGPSASAHDSAEAVAKWNKVSDEQSQVVSAINVLEHAAEDFEQAWIYQPQERPDWEELKRHIYAVINGKDSQPSA